MAAAATRSWARTGPHPRARSQRDEREAKAVFSPRWRSADWGPAEIFATRRGDRGPQGPRRRGHDPRARRPHLRPVADPPRPRRRVPLSTSRSPSARAGARSAICEQHLKLDVVDEQRFPSGALAQILKPKRRVTPAWSPDRAQGTDAQQMHPELALSAPAHFRQQRWAPHRHRSPAAHDHECRDSRKAIAGPTRGAIACRREQQSRRFRPWPTS